MNTDNTIRHEHKQPTIAKSQTCIYILTISQSMSPEILRGSHYSFETDVWSLGVVFYEMCSLNLPFFANSYTELLEKQMQYQARPVDRYGEDVGVLLMWMLECKPRNRPMMEDLVNEEFVLVECSRFNLDRYGCICIYVYD